MPENKQLAQQILERSKELFYKYEPYFNRRDGKPSWQWEFLAAAGKYKGRLALGGNRIGKILAGFQTVRMADGSVKTLEKVAVDDYVLSYDIETGNSAPTRVTQKWNHSLKECYEITFSDGNSVYAEENHPFPVKYGSGFYYQTHGKNKKRKVQRRTVRELIPRLNNSVSKRTRMLSPKQVEYLPIAHLPINPYALGVLLGDGSIVKRNHLLITSADKQIIKRVVSCLSGLAKVSAHKNGDGCCNSYGLVKSHKLASELKKLGLLGTKSDTKFIPDMYLCASVNARKELLAGLIDTDGFLYGFTVKSQQLAEGFRSLVRSLGGKATIQVVRKTCLNASAGPKEGIFYNVTWRVYDVPCELKYKLPRRTKRNCDYTNRIVRNIKSIGKHPCYCIEIEHPDHCFLIGDFVATCNSDQGAYESVLAITGKHPFKKYPKNGTLLIVGLDFNMVRDINIPKFDKFLPRNYTINSDYSKADKIWWIHGEDRNWKAQFKSSDSGRAKFQGTDVDCIWFDEEPEKIDIWPECMRGLIDREGNWWMTATPVNGTAWLKAKMEEPGIFTTTGAMWDNPYIPEEEVEKFAEDLPEEDRDVRVEGKYVVFGGNPVFNIRILNKLLQDIKHNTPALVGTLRETEAA